MFRERLSIELSDGRHFIANFKTSCDSTHVGYVLRKDGGSFKSMKLQCWYATAKDEGSGGRLAE